MSGLDIAVLTSLFPSEVRPLEGIFAERRWRGMVERGHHVRVVQPTPRVPWPLGKLFPRRFGDLGARPEAEQRGPIGIARPRYTHVTGRGAANARAFAKAGMDAVLAAGRPDVVVLDYAWPAAEAAATAGSLNGIPGFTSNSLAPINWSSEKGPSCSSTSGNAWRNASSPAGCSRLSATVKGKPRALK